METTDGLNIDHIYGLNPLRKNGWCFFCPKKNRSKASKREGIRILLIEKGFSIETEEFNWSSRKGGVKISMNLRKTDTKMMSKL